MVFGKQFFSFKPSNESTIFFCCDKIPHSSRVVMNYQELLPFNYFEFEYLLYKVRVHINLPLSVRPSVCHSGYRCMVCSAISSYSFGATALIFCRMFIHIMEVCMSTGI